MVRAISAFLDFCYLVRRPAITAVDLVEIQSALDRYHQARTIFVETGVRETLSLPRQHAITHYPRMIQQFGAPNGLDSSITESKHVKGVKEPYQ